MSDRDRDRFVALAFCRADLLFELDDRQRIVFAAGASPLLLGQHPDRLKGIPFLELITEEDRRLTAEMLEAARGQGRIDDVVVRLDGGDGLRPEVALAGYRVPDFDNHFFLALKVEPVRAAEHENPLLRDDETGLLDEGSFSTVAAERALAYKRAGGRPQITMVRIENLDELCNTLGTSDRKKLMSAVGDILAQHSLGGGTAGRMAGQDFSYLHKDEVEAEEVNLAISQAAKRLFKGAEVKPAAHTLDADGAGLAEYQVAKAIAHTIRRFTEAGEVDGQKSVAQALSGLMSDTMDSVAYLRKVIAERDFHLVYMPVCDAATGVVRHFEALTRFKDRRFGSSPYHLFCLAEEVGIVHELDLAVCDVAIRSIGALMRRKGAMPAVAVNLSGLSIANGEFVESLRLLLRKSGIQPQKLMFEITESARIEDLAAVNATIQEFRRHGFRFCLDDFGSGAASFDYLHALDVDVVKFDGPVVKRACSSEKGGELLTSMVRMCRQQGILSAAEMVEDQVMADRVRQCGVDLAQGWHFGKPDMDPFVFADRFPKK